MLDENILKFSTAVSFRSMLSDQLVWLVLNQQTTALWEELHSATALYILLKEGNLKSLKSVSKYTINKRLKKHFENIQFSLSFPPTLLTKFKIWILCLHNHFISEMF